MLQSTPTTILDPIANGIALFVVRIVVAASATSEIRTARSTLNTSSARLVIVPGVAATSPTAIAISWLIHLCGCWITGCDYVHCTTARPSTCRL